MIKKNVHVATKPAQHKEISLNTADQQRDESCAINIL